MQIFVNHLYLSGKSYQVMLPMKILLGNFMFRSWIENMQTLAVICGQKKKKTQRIIIYQKYS